MCLCLYLYCCYKGATKIFDSPKNNNKKTTKIGVTKKIVSSVVEWLKCHD